MIRALLVTLRIIGLIVGPAVLIRSDVGDTGEIILVVHHIGGNDLDSLLHHNAGSGGNNASAILQHLHPDLHGILAVHEVVHGVFQGRGVLRRAIGKRAVICGCASIGDTKCAGSGGILILSKAERIVDHQAKVCTIQLHRQAVIQNIDVVCDIIAVNGNGHGAIVAHLIVIGVGAGLGAGVSDAVSSDFSVLVDSSAVGLAVGAAELDIRARIGDARLGNGLDQFSFGGSHALAHPLVIMDSRICKLLLLHCAGCDAVQRLMRSIFTLRYGRGIDGVGELIVRPASGGNLVTEAEDGDRIADLKAIH